VHELTKQQARRVAVRAQLLAEPRPTDLYDVVEHLTAVQIDPTSAIAPSADVVLWSRLGSSYSPADLRDALDAQELGELQGMVRPTSWFALVRADMADWPERGELKDWQVGIRDWVEANGGCRHDVLELLRSDGPLPQSELPDTCAVPWRSTGWTNNKNLGRLLEFMEARGEVAVAGRDGRERMWDLAERVHPAEPTVETEEARRVRNERRLRALGIARVRTARMPGEPDDVGEAGEPAVVEGTRGQWRVQPELLEGTFEGRAALISPLDRLVHDRKRMLEIFDFDYQLEMFKPAAQRRWGYWAMPILYDERLVGKLDATADRKEGVLLVDAVHEDEPFTGKMTAAIDAEIDDLATWLSLDVVRAG
jgi:uncharacterized protein YcaQ